MTGQICRDGPGNGPSLGAARFASATSAKKSPNGGSSARGSGLRSNADARPAGRSAPPELALIGWPETLPLAAKAGVALISDIQVAVSAAHTARPQDWRRTHSR
jgi:hypothetical protein